MDINQNKQMKVSVCSVFPLLKCQLIGRWTTPCDVFARAERISLSFPLNISCIRPSLLRSLRVLEGGHR